MHTVISNYKRTEQNVEPPAIISHGNLKSTKHWLPITMSAKCSQS